MYIETHSKYVELMLDSNFEVLSINCRSYLFSGAPNSDPGALRGREGMAFGGSIFGGSVYKGWRVEGGGSFLVILFHCRGSVDPRFTSIGCCSPRLFAHRQNWVNFLQCT